MADKKKDIVLENLKGFVRLGASSCVKESIPTGHFKLDFIINYGEAPESVDLSTLKDYSPSKSLGLPMGKLVELYGEEGGGKSSLAYRIVGYAQKMGLTCAWIDTEFSFSESLAKINSVDVDDLYYSDMSNPADADVVFHAEHVFDAIVNLCKSNVRVIVLDSVANLVPKARMEKDAEQATIGIVAKLMSENLGKIVNYAAKHGVLVIFINQLREKIGVMWGDSTTTPGGRSLKHNASLRLQVSKNNSKDAEIKIQTEDGKERVIGRKSRVNIKKSRFAKPYFEGIEVPIYYEPYFPDVEEIMFDFGRQVKVITVRKEIYKWGEIDVEGRKNFIDHIKENNLQNKLFVDIKAKAVEENVILPPELIKFAEENKPEETTVGETDEKQTDEGKVKRGRKGKHSRISEEVSS